MKEPRKLNKTQWTLSGRPACWLAACAGGPAGPPKRRDCSPKLKNYYFGMVSQHELHNEISILEKSDFFFYFFEIFLMIPNDKYTWEGQKFILCFITCSLHKKSTIKLKLFDVAISVNFWCHNPSLIESPSVYCYTFNHKNSEKSSKRANSTNHPVWPLIC